MKRRIQFHESFPQAHGLGKTLMKRTTEKQFHKSDATPVDSPQANGAST